MDSWTMTAIGMVLVGAVFCCIGIWSFIKIFTETINMIIRKVRWIEGWARVLDVEETWVDGFDVSSGHCEYNAYVVLTTADESQFAGWTKEVPFLLRLKTGSAVRCVPGMTPKIPERCFCSEKTGDLAWCPLLGVLHCDLLDNGVRRSRHGSDVLVVVGSLRMTGFLVQCPIDSRSPGWMPHSAKAPAGASTTIRTRRDGRVILPGRSVLTRNTFPCRLSKATSIA